MKTKQFASQIKAARLSRLQTQKQFAAEAGVSLLTQKRAEAGKTNLSDLTRAKLNRALERKHK